MKKQLLFIACLLVTTISMAQQTFPRNGVYDERDGAYAFTNATIHTTFNNTIEAATMVIRNGKIEAVGKGITIPKGMVKIDLKGKHIYPSFIDVYSDYGIAAAEKKTSSGRRGFQKMISDKEGP